MSKNFHEQYDRPDLPLPSDRSTGLVFVAVALIIAWFWQSNQTVLFTASAIAAILATISVFRPILLRPLNILWMKFALLLSKIVNPIVMLFLFAIAIVPAGLLMQLRSDPLRKRRAENADSYWIEPQRTEKSTMSNQF